MLIHDIIDSNEIVSTIRLRKMKVLYFSDINKVQGK